MRYTNFSVSMSKINAKEKILLSQSVFWVRVEAIKYLMLNKKRVGIQGCMYPFGVWAEFCALLELDF